MSATITVLIDLPEDDRAYRFTVEGLAHAVAAVDPGIAVAVRRTDAIDGLGSGIVVAPGSPYRDPVAAEQAIERARVDGLPLIGTCGGFQHLLVEHARNVVGIPDAAHAEYGGGGTAIVNLLSCSLVESQIEIDLVGGTRLASLYPAPRATERTNCNYGLAPSFAHIAGEGGLAVAAVDDTGEVRAVERADHPFFVGTLYQPQRTSTPQSPHPLLVAFVRAAVAAAG